MLENTEGAIKKGQSRETGNTVYTRRRNTCKATTQILMIFDFLLLDVAIGFISMHFDCSVLFGFDKYYHI
jgi:hypothetical protein